MSIIERLLKEGMKKRITIVFRNQASLVNSSENEVYPYGYVHIPFGKEDVPGGTLDCRILAYDIIEDKKVLIVEPKKEWYSFPSPYIFIEEEAILDYYIS